MSSIYVGIRLPNRNEIIKIEDVNLEENVLYLKQKIADKTEFEVNKLELLYLCRILKDDTPLKSVVKPECIVHCFQKTTQYVPYQAKSEFTTAEGIRKAQELFNIIANVQINMNNRVNILQKVLNEYPEFRRNLGALIFLRDSVLFNTLHQPDVVRKLAENYPIIIEAAAFIISVVRKELAKSVLLDHATDSTNSSEEENSLYDRRIDPNRQQSDRARVRLISRQQLQAALDEIGFGSVNSLSNIAQRYTESTNDNGTNNDVNSAPISNSNSDERLSRSFLRSQLQRALDAFEQRRGGYNSITPVIEPETENTTEAISVEPPPPPSTPPSISSIIMDVLDQRISSNPVNTSNTESDIPLAYRTHQYAEQLRTMAQMGFLNHEENLTYLNLANGNIENAINLLMAAIT